MVDKLPADAQARLDAIGQATKSLREGAPEFTKKLNTATEAVGLKDKSSYKGIHRDSTEPSKKLPPLLQKAIPFKSSVSKIIVTSNSNHYASFLIHSVRNNGKKFVTSVRIRKNTGEVEISHRGQSSKHIQVGPNYAKTLSRYLGARSQKTQDRLASRHRTLMTQLGKQIELFRPQELQSAVSALKPNKILEEKFPLRISKAPQQNKTDHRYKIRDAELSPFISGIEIPAIPQLPERALLVPQSKDEMTFTSQEVDSVPVEQNKAKPGHTLNMEITKEGLLTYSWYPNGERSPNADAFSSTSRKNR